jgi:hypothetical protein
VKKLAIVCSALVLTACTGSTVIRSSDPDARIYVNGEYVGTGEANYSDRKVSFSNNEVELRKPGCQAKAHSFRRNEEPEGGAIFTGILFAVPLLWVTEYKDEHAYEYDCRPMNEG